jgi:hypothetical protein
MIPPPPDLHREPATREQRENFDVFLGRGLPENYLQWLKVELNHHQIAEHYRWPGETARDVVARALEFDNDSWEKGYQVKGTWCFLEGIPISELAVLTQGSRVMIANSRPSWKLWLLLHFQDVAPDYSAADVARDLRLHLPELSRDIGDGALAGRFEEAATRARSLDPTSAVNSNVFEFVEQVRDSLIAFDPKAHIRI